MEDERTGSLRVTVGKIAIGLVVVLVLYILSFGPAMRFVFSAPYSEPASFYTVFYTPVFWVCDHSKLIASAMKWYVDRCLPDEDRWLPDSLIK